MVCPACNGRPCFIDSFFPAATPLAEAGQSLPNRPHGGLPVRYDNTPALYRFPLFVAFLITMLTATTAAADFVEIGGLMGVDNNGAGRSVVWTDFDGDGWLDIYVGNIGENNLLLQNRVAGSLPFIDVATARGVDNSAVHSWSVVTLDYDNDGDLDLYVANDFNDPCRLYRNDGLVFVDVAASNSVTGIVNNMGVSWSDMDRDGDLDFFLSVWGTNGFFRSDGTGGFRNISSDMGTESDAIGFQVAWADYDNDGDSDLFNANMLFLAGETSHLYRNDGAFFADVSSQVNPMLLECATGAAWQDWDMDGDQDLFTARGPFVLFDPPLPNRLYRNDNGTFIDIAPQFPGMADTLFSSGGVWGDYDLDCDPDLFVNGGQDNQLWRNDDGIFVNLAAQEGMLDTTNSGPGKGAAWGDYDRDGDLDLVVVHREGTMRLYRNENANSNHWLTIRLAGVASNRDGIGAKVSVTAGSKTQYHEVQAGDGFFSQQSLPLELGVGLATSAAITVDWPSGAQQTLTNVPVDQELTITEEYLIPFQVAFGDSAAVTGLDHTGSGRGVAWADYDGDGDLDLYQANNLSPNRLYRNDGGDFVDVAPLLGVDDGTTTSLSALFVDYDNDGLPDLHVSNRGDDCRLYHNTGSGFADVASAKGLVSANKTHWGAAWADYDVDGDLDLYQTRRNEPNSLYRNDGVNFVDVAPLLGLDLSGNERMAVWGDYDDDLLPDLYVISKDGNTLFHNDGSGFTDVTVVAGVGDVGIGRGASWADPDADGDLDLYITNDGPNRYYENQGDGTFNVEEVSLGIGYPGDDYSPVWVDWDSDGKEDMTVVSEGGWPRLLSNQGSTFVDSAVLKGIGEYGYAQCSGWADYDGDGDLDFFVSGDGQANQLYERTGASGGNWIRIRLVGGLSNKAGVGAKIEVETAGYIQMRYVQAGSGWLSQGDLWPQFGLGGFATADRITVEWPSGIVDEWAGVAAGQELELQEGSTSIGVSGASPALRLAIDGNHPNPFNPTTRISYELPSAGEVELGVYDAAGREVRRLVRGTLSAGRHSVVWDGRDGRGREVSSGVYFSRITLAGKKQTHKMLLIR